MAPTTSAIRSFAPVGLTTSHCVPQPRELDRFDRLLHLRGPELLVPLALTGRITLAVQHQQKVDSVLLLTGPAVARRMSTRMTMIEQFAANVLEFLWDEGVKRQTR